MTTPTLRVNGETRTLCVHTIEELLAEMSVNPAARGVAVAVNGAVAPRSTWMSARLQGDDVVEIVKPLAGG